MADAPDGLSVQHLGAPLDANFQPLIGSGAVSMFPQAGAPSVTPMNEMHVDTSLVRSMGELKANARAWFLNGGLSTTSDRRHAFYRAVQISSVYELHDNTLMVQPPPGAVYYPWRIYTGHSYWEVVEGDSRTFSGKIGAEFLHYGGSISDFKGKYHLDSHAGGRGLIPKTGAAIFAHTPQEIQASYVATGQDVPIVVEYRQIPYAQADDGEIRWTDPKHVEVRLVSVAVAEPSPAMWRASVSCTHNGANASPPVQFLQRELATGTTYNVVFSKQFEVGDNDVLECFTTNVAAGSFFPDNPGSATTGRIDVNKLGPAGLGGQIRGGNDKVRYAVNWTAAVLP